MDQNRRFCRIKGHQESNISHICTSDKCNLKSRWNCAECITQQTHRHNDNNFQEKIMSRQELLNKLQQDLLGNSQDKWRNKIQNIDDIFQYMFQLEQYLLNFKKILENSIQQSKLSDNQQQLLKKIINECQTDEFYLIDDFKINFIVKIQTLQDLTHHDLWLESQKMNDKIKLIEKKVQNLAFQSDNQSREMQQISYQLQLIGQTETYFHGCQISNDEKYLAYGGVDQKLIIYDLNLQKEIHEFKLNGYCLCCEFTMDSKYLFVGIGGLVNQYHVENDFKLIQELKIHNTNIYGIILLDQSIITCSGDTTIIKTNLVNKKIEFKLAGHTSYIFTIYYTVDQDVLFSGGSDLSLKVWDCKIKKAIIHKGYAHQNKIVQLQPVHDYQNLLSLCRDGILKRWKIDFIKNNLIQLQEFVDPNKIYNFSFSKDEYLLIICDKLVKILNEEGKIIKQIQHEAGPNESNLEYKQLETINYFILIRSKNKIMIARQSAK